MSTIASEWRMRRLGDAIQRSQPISGEVRRGAASTLSAVALSALSAAFVWAQQNRQRVEEVPAAAPAPVSPASPSRASPSQNVSHWQQALVARLDRFKRYPAQAHGTEGVASLAFTIDRKGNVLSSQIATTSGSAVLDAEVLALVKRAAPFPPPPAVVADADLPFLGRRVRGAIYVGLSRDGGRRLDSNPKFKLKGCTMKIGKAPGIFAFSFVSCILLACKDVALADQGGNETIGDVAHRTVRNSQSRDDLAGGGLLHLYPSQQSKHESVTEKPQRSKKRHFR